MKRIENFINNKIQPPVSGNWIDNYCPAEGRVYSHLADSDERDVDQAVQAAAAAFSEWSAVPGEVRSRHLLKIADLIEQRIDELARAESYDNGKPVALARKVDIPRASLNFRFYATAAQQFSSEAHISGYEALNYTNRIPIGIAGCISPWNLPLYLFTWKIAPALAAGNCVVAKPSELTPYTASILGEICQEAGLPAGVLNIVQGYGPKVGEAIVRHQDIPAVSFTGGTKTGQRIASVAAPMFKKLSLELGGKNPNIIFADCDFEDMLETTVRSSFANQGEICLCGSRILVETPLYERFKEAFVKRVSALRVGDPQEAKTDMGALVSAGHKDKVMSYIKLAQEEGGHVLTGGHEVDVAGRCQGGYFVAPTVIEGLSSTCRTNQEEIFGPVVTLLPFEDEAEALRSANDSQYGLSATIWTQNLNRAHRFARGLKSGIVWVNCWLYRDLRTPFGGMRQSGMGREGGYESMKFFTEPQNVCIKL